MRAGVIGKLGLYMVWQSVSVQGRIFLTNSSSISHYLIEFINFVLYNRDLKEPHAMLAVLIDLSKAFNRQDHNILLTLLCGLGVPG